MIFFFFLQMIVQTFVSPRMTAIIVYKVVNRGMDISNLLLLICI